MDVKITQCLQELCSKFKDINGEGQVKGSQEK